MRFGEKNTEISSPSTEQSTILLVLGFPTLTSSTFLNIMSGRIKILGEALPHHYAGTICFLEQSQKEIIVM
jgi:hypothetical protein